MSAEKQRISVETVHSRDVTLDPGQEMLAEAQSRGRELRMADRAEIFGGQALIPDSHFSAGIDYYCYF
jgi:hypothetical protein